MPPPLKMVSHNVLRTEDEGGETAFVKAKEMGISIVRMDIRYRQMATSDGWQWDAGEGNRWNDLLEPSLRWTREHGMRTLVNLIAYQVPSHSLAVMNRAWQDHVEAASGRRPGKLSSRDCALWAGWAAGNGVDPGAPSPRDYTEALLDMLAQGQASGDHDIMGFCILNEPNTRWPGEANWRDLEIPEEGGGRTTYSTASLCQDMCGWVKDHIDAHHAGTLGHTVNVVNLYSYRRHWRDESWDRVARDPNVDVLGIDIYWDQLFGFFARGMPEAMRSLSERYGKEWWLVETAGADNPGWLWKRPSCRQVRECNDLCTANGARVLGYYRLWGDYRWPWNYGSAYNIFTDPGGDPTPRTDGRGDPYWETIRDI